MPEAEVPEARGARGQRWTFDRLGMFYHIGQGGPKIASRITHTLLHLIDLIDLIDLIGQGV